MPYLKHTTGVINNLHLLNNPPKALDKGQMDRITLDIVVSVLGILELYDKSVGNAVLPG